MSNGNNKDITSGIAGIIAIILFVAGVAFNQFPIEITRPKGVEMKSLEVESLQNVDARLWQDPFSAAKNHIESESKDNTEKTEKHKINTLKDDINNHLKSDKTDKTTVTVLGVMVRAGPYAEQAEQRRRMRYAVLAGLNKQRYILDDAEHIGYVRTRKNNPGSLESPEIIPFEWLHVIDRTRKILILWIAEDYFLDELYGKLLLLFNSLNCEKCNNNYKVKVLGPYYSGVLRKITNEKSKMEVLEQNLDEIELIRFEYYQNQVGLYHRIKIDNYFNIEFYSATTTTSAKYILPRNKLEQILDKIELIRFEYYHGLNIEFTTTVPDNCKLKEDDEIIRCIFNNRLFRTIHSDYKLADTLIEELKRRNIKPGEDTILLLFEWDTFYGQSLSKIFENIGKGADRNDDQGQKWLRRYTYLRGLDGDIPASKNEDGKQDKQKNQTAVDQQLSKERPEGTSQFDYIRRLADEIAAEIEDNNLKSTLLGKLYSQLFGDESKDNRVKGHDHCFGHSNLQESRLAKVDSDTKEGAGRNDDQGRVKAIGLLGSDVHDKLILLQALRPKLPGMVFFTTDMDARLIPHGSHNWGRNLIVASGFGLELNDIYQRGTPPFRDAYQTSIFLATQLAVCDIDLEAKHKLLDKWLKEPPRLFEIGRTKEFNITPKNPTSELNPLIPLPFSIEKVIQIFIFTIMLILVLFMFLITLRNNPVDTIKSKIDSFKASLKSISSSNMFTPILILLYFVILLLLLLYHCIFSLSGNIEIDKIAEPFLWFQGISIWPTEIIRFFTVILSFCFLQHSWKIIKEDQDNLGKRFFDHGKESTSLKNSKTGTNIFYFKKLKEENPPAKMLFNRYLLKSTLDYRLMRTFIFLMLFIFFGFFLFHELFPVSDPPARGLATFVLNDILLWASILPFWFLLFFVTDALRCSERFLQDITFYTTEWPSDLIDRYTRQWDILDSKLRTNKQIDEPNTKDPIRTNNDLVNDWLEVEVAATHTESISKLIRYPFIILILLIFALNGFFDNWAFPWSLVIVITFAFIILIFHAWRLQRAAEKLRSDALDQLYKKLIWAKGNKNSGAIADKLKLLIEQVNNLKRGAFQSFLQRPLLQWILALLGSMGVSQLLQYFYR